MADEPISALTLFTSYSTADEVEILDVSDTTFASTGTNKRIPFSTLLTMAGVGSGTGRWHRPECRSSGSDPAVSVTARPVSALARQRGPRVPRRLPAGTTSTIGQLQARSRCRTGGGGSPQCDGFRRDCGTNRHSASTGELIGSSATFGIPGSRNGFIGIRSGQCSNMCATAQHLA